MNKYEKEARVYPAIAGMIIPIILTTLYVTSFIPQTLDIWESIIVKIGLFIPVALIYGALAYWIRQLFIDASKRLFQFRLFKEDETEMPTTKLLLWSSDVRKSEADIKRIAEKIRQILAFNCYQKMKKSLIYPRLNVLLLMPLER